jgi:selenocysteine-specific elongation factor
MELDFFIIGTAGHVDHGKTQLVKALTGQDTDRLSEEKKRGISIELGFASMKLPSGRNVAIIDVPGHERFIKQMLAGVAGIDMVMLVIAADEGVMPQTREHLDIIELLQINKGIVVITKTDIVDEEWLELVEEDIKDFLQGTVLQNAPIVKVSAIKNEGIDELKKQIDNMLKNLGDTKSRGNVMRLPVDRSFSLSGFGTVVTGTLWSGEVKVSDIVEVQPSGKKTRIRGIQVHGKPQQVAKPGQRVALNLSDVEVQDVPRGSSIVLVGSFKPSFKLDAKLKIVHNADKSLKQRQRVRVHLGTSEKLARINILDKEEITPGEEAYVQLQMEDALIAQRGDHFVIRSYSPMHTIGGGIILEPYSKKIKRFDDSAIQSLKIKEESNPEELIRHLLDSTNDRMISGKEIEKELNLGLENTYKYIEGMDNIIKIESDGNVWFISKKVGDTWVKKVSSELKKYHEKYPLRLGYDKEELRTKLFNNFNTKEFNLLLNHWQSNKIIKVIGSIIQLPDFEIELDEKTRKIIKSAENEFLMDEFQPPQWEEVKNKIRVNETEAEEILKYMLGQGILIKVAENIYYHKKAIEKAKSILKEAFTKKESMVLGDIRDLLGSTRKYAHFHQYLIPVNQSPRLL